MTREERRKNWIRSDGRRLCSRLRSLNSRKRCGFIGRRPDRWSIHEIILHLADSEATCYVRCRHFIAEPGSSVSQI